MKNRLSMRFVLPLALLLGLLLISSSLRAANKLDAVTRVGNDVRYLSSDELEGRGPGTEGLRKAAEYIRDEFKRLGLKSGTEDGSYMQPFDIVIDTKVIEPKTNLVLTGPDGQHLKLELGEDFQPLATGGAGKAEAEVVFAGYGITAPKQEYDDYKDVDVAGKIVLIIRREPQQGDPKSVFDGKKTTSHSYIRTKLQRAKKQKAAAVLLVNDPFSTKSGNNDALTSPSGFGTRAQGIPFAHVGQAVANKLLAATPVKLAEEELKSIEAIEREIDTNLKPISQPLSGWTAKLEFSFEKVKTEVANVIGVLEGQGDLADETIVLGAHYDHLGYGPFGSRRPKKRAIHNGADDNASGTACVLELARRFASRGDRPRRRMVFIGFSAEERGIIGSNYYLENPVVPLKDTVTMVNFDMVGRLTGNGLLLGGARTAKEFPDLVERANGDGSIKVKTSGSVGASDHAGFYRKSIPVLFFFTGLTKEYHTPDDDFETINVEGMVRTLDYAERLLDELVNLPSRPEFVKSKQAPRGRGAMAYLGIVPDYAGTTDGLRVTDVNAGSPASTGGLKPGDVIIKFADLPVVDIQGLSTGLRKHKPGDEVKLVVKRDDKQLSLDVTLGKPPTGN